MSTGRVAVPATTLVPARVDLRAPFRTSSCFVIDSLRRDYLSPYNPAVTFTPSIDEAAPPTATSSAMRSRRTAAPGCRSPRSGPAAPLTRGLGPGLPADERDRAADRGRRLRLRRQRIQRADDVARRRGRFSIRASTASIPISARTSTALQRPHRGARRTAASAVQLRRADERAHRQHAHAQRRPLDPALCGFLSDVCGEPRADRYVLRRRSSRIFRIAGWYDNSIIILGQRSRRITWRRRPLGPSILPVSRGRAHSADRPAAAGDARTVHHGSLARDAAPRPGADAARPVRTARRPTSASRSARRCSCHPIANPGRAAASRFSSCRVTARRSGCCAGTASSCTSRTW